MLKLGLLLRLMMLGLPFVIESLTAVAALCCGSALRADFFLKTMLEAADDGAAFVC